MHRLIAKTHYDMICHHRNRNSLDNRRANLVNMPKDDHHRLHGNDNLIVKYADPQHAPGASTPPVVPVKTAFNPDNPAIYIDDYPPLKPFFNQPSRKIIP